jgi:signal transduction histidine kinase
MEITELRELEDLQQELLDQLAVRVADLAFERDRLDTVIESIVDAVIVCDEQGLITIANGGARELVGEDLADGRHTLADYGRALQPRYRGSGRFVVADDLAIAVALRGEAVRDREETIVRPASGHHVDLLSNAAPLRDAAGRIVGAVGVIRDVTVLGELEHAKDQFVSVAAHELKTPVAVMKGYAQMLLRAPDAVTSTLRHTLVAIDRGADRIDRIVRQLLDISQLQTAGLELVTERFDLADLAGQVVSKYAATAPRHQLRLVREGTTEVDADRFRIESALVALVDNAIRYSPLGGIVEVSVVGEGERVMVSVSDQGVGIPDAKQALIFERFYRAHTHTANDYGGMGISLFIAREVVRSHGGEVWFTSREGEGSRFCFSLPVTSINRQDQ